MKKSLLMMVLIMSGSMAMTQPSREKSNSNHQRSEHDMHQKHGKEMLNLSEPQKDQMKTLRLEHLKATQATKNRLDIKRAELDAAIAANQPVDKLVKEINTLHGDLFAAKIKHKVAMRNVLDENQKLLYDQMEDHGNFQKQGRRGK